MPELYNSHLLRSIRIKHQKDFLRMATVIEKSESSYRKKENGVVLFLPDEIVAISKELNLTYEDVNDIFFGSQLPIRNIDLPYKTVLDV